jgi:hypothetical protein
LRPFWFMVYICIYVGMYTDNENSSARRRVTTMELFLIGVASYRATEFHCSSTLIDL